MSDHFYIKYQLKSGDWRFLNNQTKEFTTLASYNHVKEPKFDILSQKDGSLTDEFALIYLERFNVWCDELKNKIMNGFDYRQNFSDTTNVSRIFNYLCNKREYEKVHTPLSITEYKWFEKCYNGGRMMLDPKYKNKIIKTYGHDFKSYYGLLMGSKELKIPTKEGKEKQLSKLPKKYAKLKPGFYHVEITCNNPDFLKIFSFSSSNVYLDISLAYAMKHQKQFDVNINLIINDDEPNCYLYRTKDMIILNTLTNRWMRTLLPLKEKYPKNRLLKHIISTAWGTMNASNVISKTYEEILQMEKYGCQIGLKLTNDFMIEEHKKYKSPDGKIIKELYLLLDTKTPYKHNIRLKPWIVAHGRNIIGDMALKVGLEHVVRVHTDNICLTKPYDFQDVNFVAEDKSTGMILWENCNVYHKMKYDEKTQQYIKEETIS